MANGGAGRPTWNGAAAALGVTEAAADGLALGATDAVADGVLVGTAMLGSAADGGGGIGRERQESPEQQPRDQDPDDEAGDDRQDGLHIARKGTSTSGRRRLEGSTATMPLPWPTS